MLGLGGLRLQYTLWGPGLFLMRDYGTAQAHAQNYNVPRCKNQETAVDQTLETQYHCTSLKKSISLHGQKSGVRTPPLKGPYRVFLLFRWA